MSDTIAILGATGVYGRHLVPRLVAAGYRVRALVRRPEAARIAEACGAELRVADIFDATSLRAGLEGCAVGVNLAPTLPGPSGRGDFAANDRLRREGTPVWLAACRDAAVDMEASVRAAELDWAILRGGLFYGPGTGFDDEWFARAQAGKLRFPGDGRDWVSLVHIADMAQATVAALERWPSRRTLIVADDEPVRWRELFSYVAAVAGTAPPEPGGRAAFPSWRVSNRRARAALAWAAAYASYRMGLAR